MFKLNAIQKSQIDKFLSRIFAFISDDDIPKGLLEKFMPFLSDVCYKIFYYYFWILACF